MNYHYASWTLKRRSELDCNFGKRLNELLEIVRKNVRPVNHEALQKRIEAYQKAFENKGGSK